MHPLKSRSISKKELPRLKILVSSAVHGYVDLLESIYALLETFGYAVMMSHKARCQSIRLFQP